MSRQEEADKILLDLHTHKNFGDLIALDKYTDKYLKPKDPLWETFLEYHAASTSQILNLGELYQTFRLHFKKYLNGTAGLDELEKKLCEIGHVVDKIEYTKAIKEVKERLNNEA